MSHFFTLVMLPGDTPFKAIDEKVKALLAPYDEGMKVAPYKSYIDQEDIQAMAAHYTCAKDDLFVLSEHMQDWAGCTGGVDRQGLYCWRTYNPLSKWYGGEW